VHDEKNLIIEICPTCKGSGKQKQGSISSTCITCGGKGKIRYEA
jgi:DnaJ-class molecular chaperone